jgi:uncharacterized protein YacL
VENNLGKKKMFLTLQILATIYMLFVFPIKNMKTPFIKSLIFIVAIILFVVVYATFASIKDNTAKSYIIDNKDSVKMQLDWEIDTFFTWIHSFLILLPDSSVVLFLLSDFYSLLLFV